MKTKNERGAGRKPKYTEPTKLVKVPISIIPMLEKLCEPLINKKLK